MKVIENGTRGGVPIHGHPNTGAIALVNVVDKECSEETVSVRDSSEGGRQTEERKRRPHLDVGVTFGTRPSKANTKSSPSMSYGDGAKEGMK